MKQGNNSENYFLGEFWLLFSFFETNIQGSEEGTVVMMLRWLQWRSCWGGCCQGKYVTLIFYTYRKMLKRLSVFYLQLGRGLGTAMTDI